MSRKFLAVTMFAMFATLVAGVAIGLNVNVAPSCPTEDACHVDYRNGGVYVQPGEDVDGEWVPSGEWERVTK